MLGQIISGGPDLIAQFNGADPKVDGGLIPELENHFEKRLAPDK